MFREDQDRNERLDVIEHLIKHSACLLQTKDRFVSMEGNVWRLAQ